MDVFLCFTLITIHNNKRKLKITWEKKLPTTYAPHKCLKEACPLFFLIKMCCFYFVLICKQPFNACLLLQSYQMCCGTWCCIWLLVWREDWVLSQPLLCLHSGLVSFSFLFLNLACWLFESSLDANPGWKANQDFHVSVKCSFHC